MARIRALKPDFFKDEDLAELPFWVRLLFQGLWCHADREGRIEDRPLKIKAEIFPYDKISVIQGIDLLAQPKKHSPNHRPFVVRYKVDGENYLQIIEFLKHQSPHHTERDSVIPPYNGEVTVKEPLEKGYEQDAHYPKSMNLSSLSYNKIKGEYEGIIESDIESWAKAYEACDIKAEIRRSIEWLKANPKKANKSNWRKFIQSWLSRSQDRGGGLPSNRPQPKSALDLRIEKLKKEEGQ